MLNLFLSLTAFAQEAVNEAVGTAAPADSASPAPAAGGFSSLIMIVAMIAIFYFLMIRPQQKKQKEIRKMREALKEGDRVITAGGIHGKIKAVKDATFSIQIANDVIIKVDRNSVYPDNTPAEDIAVAEK